MNRTLRFIDYKGIKVSVLELPNTDCFKVIAEHALGAELESLYKKDTGRDVYGISHLIEHLGFKSTRDYSTLELKKLLRDIGVHNASSWHNEVMYHFTSITSHYKDVIKAMVNVVNNDLKSVTEEEFNAEKSVVYNEIKMYEDDKSNMFGFEILPILLNLDKNDTVLGDKEIVLNSTLEDLVKLKSWFLDTPELISYHIEYDPTAICIGEILEELYRVHNSFSFNVDNSIDISKTSLMNKTSIIPNTVVKEVDIEQVLYNKYIPLNDDNDCFLDSLVYRYLLNQPTGHSLYELVRDREGLVYYIALGANLLRGVRFISLKTETSKGNEETLLNTIEESLIKSRDNVNESVFNDLKRSHIIKNNLMHINQTVYTGYRNLKEEHPYTFAKYEHVLSTNIDSITTISMDDLTYDVFKSRVVNMVDSLLDTTKYLVITNSEDIKK